ARVRRCQTRRSRSSPYRRPAQHPERHIQRVHPMNRPLSQLIYARIQDTPSSPRIVTLHKHNQYAADVKDYAFAASPNARIIGLESYKGVFVGKEIVGYTWFIGPQQAPSPIFFGDALAEIERFLWDEIDRQETASAELPFLIGVEQGAIMALAAAAMMAPCSTPMRNGSSAL